MLSMTQYWIMDVLVSFTLLFVVSYFYMTRKFKYWKKRGVVEKTPTPFIGNFGDCLTAKRSGGQWLGDLYNYSAGLPYMGFYIFDRPALLIRDPELIKNILVRDFNYFHDRFARASDPLGKASIFFLKNPEWKLLRLKVGPLYTLKKLKEMFGLMVEVGDDLVSYMNSLNLDGKGKNLEVKDISAKFTTDMIATTAFGMRANSLNNHNAEFRECGRNVFRTTLYRNIELVSIFFLPNIVKTLGFRIFSKKNSEFLRNSMWNVLMERERSGMKRNDLIDILVELRKAYHESTNKGIFEFDGDNLVAQTAIFFIAGSDTSSTALSFALYELAVNPEVQSQLRKEIVEGLEQSDGKITYDLIMNLPYLNMVVAETLRKYPPLSILDRVANDNYKIPDSDLIIEKGTPVYIPLMGLHYDPQHFPDPHKFDPERFSEENKKLRKPFSYIPFGDGPHFCIGMRMGLLQTMLGIIKLLTKYEFSPCKETLIPMRFSPRAMPTIADGGIFLNVKTITAV